MLVSVRLILSVWSFLHEVLFGKKTFVEALRTNPGKVILLTCFVTSLAINIRIIPMVLALNERNVVLERSYKELQEQTKDGNPSFEEVTKLKSELKKLKGEVENKPHVPHVAPPPLVKKIEDDSDWVLNQFEAINKRESNDVHRQNKGSP